MDAAQRRLGIVSRGTRVYLRTLQPDDLDYLSGWADDPVIDRMVGSEFLNAYRTVYDKDPSFYDATLLDTTQVVLIVEANRGWDKPVGLARLFNIHLLEGYCFLDRLEGHPPRFWRRGGQAHLVLWSGRAGAAAHRSQGVRVQPPERELVAA
jgi:RimJ/RimL family protein N-acetyltransferase